MRLGLGWAVAVWLTVMAAPVPGQVAPQEPPTAVAMARPLTGIVVDGNLSDWPDDLPRYPIARHQQGIPPHSAQDLTASFRVARTPDGDALLLAVEVRDDSRAPIADPASRHDACMVYLRRPQANGVAVAPYQFEMSSSTADGLRPLDRSATGSRAGVRQYEWQLALADSGYGRLQGIQVIGMDILFRDADTDGSSGITGWAPGGYVDVGVYSGVSPEVLGRVILAPDGLRAGTLAAQVTWGTGEPAGHVRVGIAGADEATAMEVATDAAGRLEVSLPEGAYTVEALRQSKPAQVAGGATTTLELRGPARLGAVDAAPSWQSRPAGSGRREGDWYTLSPLDGLDSQPATSMITDGDGHLLVTIGRQITRYDGASLQSLTPFPRTGSWLSCLAHGPGRTLWIGSKAGLARYDSSGLTWWTTEDGLPADGVSQLSVDPDGDAWVGTSRGLARLSDGRVHTVTAMEGLSGNQIVGLHVARAGGIWVATEAGVALYREGRVTPLDWPFDTSLYEYGGSGGILEDEAGHLWAAVDEGVFRYVPGAGWEQMRGPWRQPGTGQPIRGAITNISQDGSGSIWVSIVGQGVFRFDGESWRQFTVTDGLPNDQLLSATVDKAGQIWFGALEGGVCRYDAERRLTLSTREGLPSNLVFSALADTRGAVWLATLAGVARWTDEGLESFAHVDGLDGVTGSLYEDRRGDVWVSAGQRGAFRYDGQSFHHFGRRDGLPSETVSSFTEDAQGALWAATGMFRPGGAARLEGDAFVKSEAHRELPDDALRLVTSDRQGHLWFAHGKGLSRLDEEGFTHWDGSDGLPPAQWIAALQEDARGQVWIGTSQGIYRLTGRGWEAIRPPGTQPALVLDIVEDRRGTLWFAAWGQGIRKWDGRVWQSLLHRDGLPSNAVQSLSEAANGDMWIGTERGAFRYRPGDTPPTIRVSEILADRRYGPRHSLELPVTQDFVEFQFQGVSMNTRPERMVYLYRLLGHDDEWHQTREQSVAYNRLGTGDYVFEVKCVDVDHNYSEPTTVELVVHVDHAQVATYVVLGLSFFGLMLAVNTATRRRQERDQTRAALVQERQRHIEVRPHYVDRWTVDDIVALSPAMQRVVSAVRELQGNEDRVLLAGEAGVGKELLARAIHSGSPRRDGAFVPVRCAGLPRELSSLAQRTQALSILFGHVEGAVPGETGPRQGLVQQAAGGVLYLDEIALLPLPLQAHLLRVLTDGQVRPIGASADEPVDVRVMAATSDDLAIQVEIGDFSGELLEYLAVQRLAVPPLRDRSEDIGPLAQQLVAELAAASGLHPRPLSDVVLGTLATRPFPGNVRELRRDLEQALRAAGDRDLNVHDLSLPA